MKKTTIWNILLGFVLALQLAAEALTAAAIIRLNLLPDKYMIVLVLGLALLAILTSVLLFLRFGKPVSTARRIIACLLALLIVCGCGLVSKLASDAYKTMHAVTGTVQSTSVRNMYVFVRTDDPAKTLADTAGYQYAHVENYDEEHTLQAVALVEAHTGVSPAVRLYPTITQVAESLLSGESDAVILNGASVALLLEEEKFHDFLEQARILHTVSLSELEASQPASSETTEQIQKDMTNAPFVVYLSGSDTRSQYLSVSRSDVNILVVVNPLTKQILLLNTPRDYFIPNPAGNGKLDKLTHCGNFGVETSMEALEGLYNVEIGHYAQINFSGFKTLVDAVGGITVYSDQSFETENGHIAKGENHLNGELALGFSRERYRVNGGDNGRGRNQMKVIKALIEKMTTGTTIISNYTEILNSLEGMFKTSVSMEEISALVKMQLSDMARWNVQSFAVTGTGGYEVTYSWPGESLYVMHPNEEVVKYAKQLVERVVSGDILTEEDMTLPAK